MCPILDGNEVEQEFDAGAGKVVIDVDVKGSVKLAVAYAKSIGGYADVESSLAVKASLFKILKEVTKKTSTTWDDAAVALLMKLLGIEDEAVIAEAKEHLQAA